MTNSFTKRGLILGVVISFALLLPLISTVSADDEESNHQESSENNEEVEQRADTIKENAKRRVRLELDREEEKEQNKEDRQVRRQDACDARKAKIVEKMSGLQGRGVAFGQKVDSFVIKVDKFVAKHSLVVDGYDDMLVEVQTAQSDLAESLAVAASLRVDISCSNPDDVKTSVEAYKDALAIVKQDAKVVVSKIKAMANAVKQAAREQLVAEDDQDDSDTTTEESEDVTNE